MTKVMIETIGDKSVEVLSCKHGDSCTNGNYIQAPWPIVHDLQVQEDLKKRR